LEETSFRNRTADFFWFLFVSAGLMLVRHICIEISVLDCFLTLVGDFSSASPHFSSSTFSAHRSISRWSISGVVVIRIRE
jgi:hypothetical protein